MQEVHSKSENFRLYTACFLIVTIVMLASEVSAQYRHTVHLGSTVDDVKSGDTIQVYFATSDAQSLGYFADRSGHGTSQVLADMPLDRWSNWYAKKKRRLQSGKATTSYRWIVRSLSATSDTLTGYLFTHLAADILRSSTIGGYYRWAASVDTVLSFVAGDSLPFAQALASTMDLLYEVSVSSKDNPKKKTQMLFGNRSLADRDYTDSSLATLSLSLSYGNGKILTDTVYTKGVYRSFSEFLGNAPSANGSVWIAADSAKGNGYVKLYRLGSDSSVSEVGDAWGICLGGHEIYKLEAGRLVPIEKSGNGFVLSRYLDYRTRKNQALAWRMAVGSSWPNDNNPYERKRAETLRGFLGKKAPVATRLDLLSGELTF